jgi:serine/threonine protein kinase
MSIILQFSAVALKGFGGEAASDGLNVLVGMLRKRFADNSKKLNAALERSANRAWRATELALAGTSWWDRCKAVLSTADQRAFRDQIQAFLKAHPLDGLGHGPDFRGTCLAQLQAARKAGLLDRGKIDPDELAMHVGDLSRFGDQQAVMAAEYAKLTAAAAILRQHGYDALAAFVEMRPADGPPLLVSAMRYFFRREVETDHELFQGIVHTRLENLAEGQQAGFSDLAEALDRHGDKLESLLSDVLAVVTQTRDDVLDVKAEVARQGQQMQELGQAVLRALAQRQMESRELRISDSLSVRDEDERRLVKDLVRRYRSLPTDQRKKMPALLNAVGKLEVVAGDFESAERDFREVTQIAGDPRAKAEAAYNLYRAALERRAWAEALESFKEAVTLDAVRFAPFPVSKFEPEKILGAGGFGVAFLCRNRHSGASVVIKTLRRDGLDRDLNEVFREAQALEALEHPAIIRVRDCDYADSERTRPYLVMDYFQGQNLADFVEQNGQLQTRELLPLARMVAEGLQKAHGMNILHRDVKPANLLVRRAPSPTRGEGGAGFPPPSPLSGRGGAGGGEGWPAWEAKLIDFGLAMRADSAPSTRKATMDRTLIGSSIAGTIEYAAPEQMGKLKGVAVGTYSDVYGFAKTCCFALFGTAQPTYQHWQSIPRELADLLGRCLSEPPKGRPQDFAAVLTELDRLLKPREVPVPQNLPEVIPVTLDAIPVEEPRRRAEPPRREPPPPRREEPRRQRVEDLPEVRPARRRVLPRPSRRRVKAGLLVMMTLGLLAVGAGVWYFGFSRRGPVTFPQALLNRPPDGGAFNWPNTQEPKYAPIKPAHFREKDGVIDTFNDNPSDEWLKTIAGRLAETEPTEEQKKKHEDWKTKKALLETKACPKEACDEAAKLDDVLIVSRGLNRLTNTKDLQAKKNVTRALLKWGTMENVDGLIVLTEAEDFGADVVRVNACKALARLPSQKGANAVAARLVSNWMEEEKGVTEALSSYKDRSLAENAVLACIEGGTVEATLWPHKKRGFIKYDNVFSKRRAVVVLGRIGSLKSLKVLEQMKEDLSLRRNAEEAISAIKKRYPDKAD